MLYLTESRGPLVIAFALAGLFISVFYVAPPIRLKHIGLGEPGVFIVWGPLMTGGTFFVATGEIPGWVWIASLPYAILVTTVLFGKHIDKIEADTKKGVRTLPVILGERWREDRRPDPDDQCSTRSSSAAAIGWIGPWVALVLLGLPKLISTLRTFSVPRPETPPHSYVGWPQFVGAAFVHTRRAGALLHPRLPAERHRPDLATGLPRTCFARPAGEIRRAPMRNTPFPDGRRRTLRRSVMTRAAWPARRGADAPRTARSTSSTPQNGAAK